MGESIEERVAGCVSRLPWIAKNARGRGKYDKEIELSLRGQQYVVEIPGTLDAWFYDLPIVLDCRLLKKDVLSSCENELSEGASTRT